jgi:hypothetical protein
VVLTEEDKFVVLTSTTNYSEVRIEKSRLTRRRSVLSESKTRLARLLAAHLFLFKHDLRWFETMEFYYMAREDGSKFLNQQFLDDRFGLG